MIKNLAEMRAFSRNLFCLFSAAFLLGATPDKDIVSDTEQKPFEIIIVGAVKTPGRYLIRPQTMDKEAIEKAGGTAENVWYEASVIITGPKPYKIVKTARDKIAEFLALKIPPDSILHIGEHIPY